MTLPLRPAVNHRPAVANDDNQQGAQRPWSGNCQRFYRMRRYEHAQRATQRAAALNESYLRRIGADLHDGPAQLIAYASLRLDSQTPTSSKTCRWSGAAHRQDQFDDAMAEIWEYPQWTDGAHETDNLRFYTRNGEHERLQVLSSHSSWPRYRPSHLQRYASSLCPRSLEQWLSSCRGLTEGYAIVKMSRS